MILGLIWNAVLYWLIAGTPGVPERFNRFDERRCYTDQAAFVRRCYPRSGCFYTAPDTVLCWRALDKKLR